MGGDSRGRSLSRGYVCEEVDSKPVPLNNREDTAPRFVSAASARATPQGESAAKDRPVTDRLRGTENSAHGQIERSHNRTRG